MTGYRFSRAEVVQLAGPAGPELLGAAHGLPLRPDTLLTDLTALRRVVGELAPAVAETERLRRAAVGKLAGDGWLLTDEALQQAAPTAVAAHRAARLAGIAVHDLTCSVGGDLVALPGSVGSDLDEIRVLMARHNLAAHGATAGVFVADALTRTSRGLLPYADPARRDATGRRITSVDTLPSVADLDRVHADRPPVLRLPPGIDYDALARPGEVEIVSLDGAAREAVLWPAELARVARRASVLRTGGPTETVTSDDPDEITVGPVRRYLVDPDPAVVRSGLVRHWAARHGLSQLDPHLAYLTGDTPPPGIRSFEVTDSAPFTERVVRDWIRRDGAGTLEIKQRGTPVIPDELRKRLRPALDKGARSLPRTLVLARVGRAQLAYWSVAVPAAG